MGGHFFTTRIATLVSDNDSMLSSMFSGRFKLEVDDKGRYFIDRDGQYFGHILNYLRDPSLLPPSSVALQVYQEAKYYGIEGLVEQLECYPSVIPQTRLEDQKSSMGEYFEYWKQTVLDTARKKYGDVMKYSLGQECMVTAVRYISRHDYLSAVTKCKHNFDHFIEGSEKKKPSHNFFCSDENGSRLSFYIGCDLPNVDFAIPEDEIPDSRLFTSVLEKDLLNDGFCVSARSSHSWKCSRCEIVGYLHQVAFTWSFAHVHESVLQTES